MNNFGVRYAVDGTSALDPKAPPVPALTENIISFPRGDVSSEQSTATQAVESSTADRFVLPFQRAYARVLDTEMAQSLRYGTAQGHAYGRIRPWQAVIAGCVFSLLALASIFLDM